MPRTSQVELPGCPRFRAICCDSLGLIKVIEAEVEAGAPKVVARWGDPDPRRGIRCVSLSSDTSPKLAVARKTNTVEILDSASGALQSQLVVAHDSAEKPGREGREGSDGVCGLNIFSECSSRGPAVLTCTEYGDTALQRLPYEGKVCERLDDNNPMIVKWNISQTGSVLCMSVDGGEHYAAFGGKGVDVNVWDIAMHSKLWSSKTPRRDNLGLISPAWVTAVTFLSKDDHRKIVIGTGHHQVRLYDLGAQRRPVFAFDYGESPIKTVTQDPDGHSVYVGTGGGDLACFDMRTGKLVGGFKGKCAGSIRAVVRHPVLPLIVSCGLDRYLRVHNTKTRQLLGSLFLKQQLVDVVFDLEENMLRKASTLKSDGIEQTIMGQAGEANPDVGTIKPRLVKKGLKVKRENVQATPDPERVPLDQENGRLKDQEGGRVKDKTRCLQSVHLERADKCKRTKVVAKRLKPQVKELQCLGVLGLVFGISSYCGLAYLAAKTMQCEDQLLIKPLQK